MQDHHGNTRTFSFRRVKFEWCVDHNGRDAERYYQKRRKILNLLKVKAKGTRLISTQTGSKVIHYSKMHNIRTPRITFQETFKFKRVE